MDINAFMFTIEVDIIFFIHRFVFRFNATP